MSNVVGLINDITASVVDSTIKKNEVVSFLTDVLLILRDNGFVDGDPEEFERLEGVNADLDTAIETFLSIVNDEDQLDEDSEDDDDEW